LFSICSRFVPSLLFQGNLLNRGTYFLGWPLLLQRSVETRSTDAAQLTHAFDTQGSLQGHHVSDLLGRCRLARSAALLASSLDFLQGTFEKIRFQCFLG